MLFICMSNKSQDTDTQNIFPKWYHFLWIFNLNSPQNKNSKLQNLMVKWNVSCNSLLSFKMHAEWTWEVSCTTYSLWSSAHFIIFSLWRHEAYSSFHNFSYYAKLILMVKLLVRGEKLLSNKACFLNCIFKQKIRQ